MKVKIKSSTSPTFLLALEEIKSSLPGKPDFLMVALANQFPGDDVIPYISEIFETDNFVAFHAIDAFDDVVIVKGVTVCAFYFSGCGEVTVKEIWNYRSNDLIDEVASYLNGDTERLHLFLGVPDEGIDFFIERLSANLLYRPVNNIIGGLSSGHGDRICVFTSNGKIDKGGVIVSFKNFSFQVGIALGFKPYGVTYTINKAVNRKIYTVDDQSASSLFERLLRGIEEGREKVLWFAPLYLVDDKEGYVATLRTPSKIEDDFIEVFGEIKSGERFKLSFAFPEDLLEESRKIAKEVKEKIKRVDLTFNFSCVARQFVLGEEGKKELEIYSSELNSHLFGFFTYGEVGPDRQFRKLKLYNETSLIVALREECNGKGEGVA